MIKSCKLLTGKRYKMNFLKLSTVFLFTIACAIGCTKPAQEPTPTPKEDSTDNKQPSETKLSYTKKTAPVLFEMTSTGCPGCGGWGKPTFARLVNSYGSDITPIAVHIKYGDPMITTESQAIWDNIIVSRYTPMIFVQDENAVKLNGSSISVESEANAKMLIDAALVTETPALAAVVTKADDKWSVTYGAQFAPAMADGEYSLSCYLIEDGLVYQQTSYANNPATHNNVIRTSASGAFGNSFSMADMTDNEITWQADITISNEYKKDNLYIAVVLWKKTGEHYAAVNGYILK